MLGIAVGGAALALLAGGSIAYGHDLFLRPVSFFVAPGNDIVLRVMNGTFSTSEGAVKRDRPRDLRIAGPSGTRKADTLALEPGKTETLWRVPTSASGTYAIGMSLFPRTIRLEGKDFNEYLKSDGIPEILALRGEKGELNSPARERYSKHVKALVQVGSLRSAKVDEVFGYPVEIVPLDNPYRLAGAGSMRVRLMVDGQPAIGQTMLFGGRSASGKANTELSLRSGPGGIVTLRVPGAGKWYAKFISMRKIAESAHDSVDYESKWATLTFGVR